MKSRIIAFTALLAMCSAAAAQSDVPRRKSGLWQISTAQGQHRPVQFQECVDQKSDHLMRPESMGEEMKCDKGHVRREGAGYVLEATCKANGSTARIRAVFSGNFESAYKVDAKTSFSLPYHGVRESSVQMEGKWLGPCKPGQKPGVVGIPGMPIMDELMKG